MAQSLSKMYIHIVFHKKYNSPIILKETKQELYAYMGAIIKDNGSIPILPKIRKEISITDSNGFISVNKQVNLNHHSGCYGSIVLLADILPFEPSLRHLLAEFRY